MDAEALETRTLEFGREIFARARKHDFFRVDRWLDRRLMGWGMAA